MKWGEQTERRHPRINSLVAALDSGCDTVDQFFPASSAVISLSWQTVTGMMVSQVNLSLKLILSWCFTTAIGQ